MNRLKSLILNFHLEFISILILLLSLPLYLQINFMQNDDWAYYQNIFRFLDGNFFLIPKTAPTFYSVGIIAAIWSLIFTTGSLPILTLIISIGNFYIFARIISLKFHFSKLTTFLASLILYTNFFHSYSSIGFMTENYLVFFLLLSIFYFEKSEKSSNLKYLYLSNIFSFLTFLVKQSGIIFLCATTVYFFLNKDFKKIKIQLIFLASQVFFYLFLFPKTSEMNKKNFLIDNFNEPNYIYSLIYGILIYLAFFTFPLIFSSVISTVSSNYKNLKNLILFLVISSVLYFVLNHFFKPEYLAWQEFPYFQNIFERTGFLPRTVGGTKYQFKYNFIYYFYSALVSKISVSVFISVLIFKFKKILNVYSISITGFVVLMLFVSPFFDRYLLYVIPLSILFLLDFYEDILISKVILILFVLYQLYFSYFLTRDFIQTHNYIWKKSQDLVNLEILGNPSAFFDMQSTGAWTNTYGRNRNNPKYIFTYDSPSKNPEMLENYKVLEIKKVDFNGNLFINPEVYLYKFRN